MSARYLLLLTNYPKALLLTQHSTSLMALQVTDGAQGQLPREGMRSVCGEQ